ncbi:MAG: hypothetical protein ABSG78_09090 [Verrucomicrobiota bacterium]|jgi:hypothetical protein
MKLEATVYRWSIELGKKQETLARRLRLAGVKVEPRVKISASDMFRALSGGLHEAKTREANARADLLESKLKELKDDFAPVAEIEASFRAIMGPARDRLLTLPLEAARCNPANPELARQALEDLVHTLLPCFREENCKFERSSWGG